MVRVHCLHPDWHSAFSGRLQFCLPLQDGWTPLHYAARAGRAEVVQALIRAGANTAARTKVRRGRTAMFALLISVCSSFLLSGPLLNLARSEYPSTVRVFPLLCLKAVLLVAYRTLPYARN